MEFQMKDLYRSMPRGQDLLVGDERLRRRAGREHALSDNCLNPVGPRLGNAPRLRGLTRRHTGFRRRNLPIGFLASRQQTAFRLQPDRFVAVVGTTLLLPELARAGRDFIMGRGERGAGLGGGVGVEMAVVVVFHQGIEVERWSVIRFDPGVIKIERTPSARSGRHARPARLS